GRSGGGGPGLARAGLPPLLLELADPRLADRELRGDRPGAHPGVAVLEHTPPQVGRVRRHDGPPDRPTRIAEQVTGRHTILKSALTVRSAEFGVRSKAKTSSR